LAKLEGNISLLSQLGEGSNFTFEFPEEEIEVEI